MQALLLFAQTTLRYGICGYGSLLTVAIDWKDSLSAKVLSKKVKAHLLNPTKLSNVESAHKDSAL